jgi:HEAT repeat protein
MGRLQFAALARRAAPVIALLLASGLSGARGDERDVAAEFKGAKASLTQQLRDKKKENRLAAVHKLESFPTPEAAKLLLFQGLSSSDEDVRRGSFEALASMNGDKEICSFLKTTVAKQWKQGKPQPETYAGLAILLASELPDVREEATELVKDAAERPAQGRIVLITLADELGNCRGDSACRSLVQLMELPLFHQDFAFRRAVVQALSHVRAKPAVTTLIKLLAAVKGEVRADIVHYLSEISGQQMGLDAQAWSGWWKQQEEKFEFPPEKKLLLANVGPAMPKPPAAGPSYYGLPLSGAKIIFVIDTSGSMNGPRIIAAKRELTRAIEELPADVEFNVIAFNGRTYPWQAKLVIASPEFKQSAIYFVASQVLGSGTASYDALEAALRFDGEAIYFLTDGAPFGGKITSPPEIVRNISRLNQFRRLTINSLGIGVGLPGNAFDSFLSTLAKQNFGEYQRVDQ